MVSNFIRIISFVDRVLFEYWTSFHSTFHCTFLIRKFSQHEEMLSGEIEIEYPDCGNCALFKFSMCSNK